VVGELSQAPELKVEMRCARSLAAQAVRAARAAHPYEDPVIEVIPLVAELPVALSRVASITDRYLDGTTLRLRRLETNREIVFKVGQKVRRNLGDPEWVNHTSIYLTVEEHERLARLPHHELRTTRWRAGHNGIDLATDEFHDRLEGLVLAEVELSDDQARLDPPPFALSDVTNDNRFSGGALASASDEEVVALLEHRRDRRGPG
jgi:CYTH domain-containing protein